MRKASPIPEWRIELGVPIGPGNHPMRELIADLLDEMDDRHSRPLEMWAWEGLTFQQIADELGLAGRQSGQDRVRAGLRELRRLLDREGINYETTPGEPDGRGSGERQLRGPEDGVRRDHRRPHDNRPART